MILYSESSACLKMCHTNELIDQQWLAYDLLCDHNAFNLRPLLLYNQSTLSLNFLLLFFNISLLWRKGRNDTFVYFFLSSSIIIICKICLELILISLWHLRAIRHWMRTQTLTPAWYRRRKLTIAFRMNTHTSKNVTSDHLNDCNCRRCRSKRWRPSNLPRFQQPGYLGSSKVWSWYLQWGMWNIWQFHLSQLSHVVYYPRQMESVDRPYRLTCPRQSNFYFLVVLRQFNLVCPYLVVSYLFLYSCHVMFHLLF